MHIQDLWKSMYTVVVQLKKKYWCSINFTLTIMLIINIIFLLLFLLHHPHHHHYLQHPQHHHHHYHLHLNHHLSHHIITLSISNTITVPTKFDVIVKFTSSQYWAAVTHIKRPPDYKRDLAARKPFDISNCSSYFRFHSSVVSSNP